MSLCASCLTMAHAQTVSFTQRLQQQRTGEGTVTVTHSETIDKLVNTPPVTTQAKPATTPSKPATPTTTPRATTPRDSAESRIDTPVIDNDSIDSRKKVMKGYKVNGYRVQVFAGGNSRNDRIKAEATGSQIKGLFPDEPVYVHFYSPRWICRMGNYRTYEEAHEVLLNVKKLGYDSAIIVKGKITVPQP